MATTYLGMAEQESGSLQTDALFNPAIIVMDACIAGNVSREFTTDANITLTSAEYWTSCLVFTDSPSTLTAGRDVVFPANFPMMLVRNATAQTLTLKKSGQAGVTVAAAAKAVIASGPTDVEKA